MFHLIGAYSVYLLSASTNQVTLGAMKGTAYAAVQNNTVDASEIRDSAVGVGSFVVNGFLNHQQ